MIIGFGNYKIAPVISDRVIKNLQDIKQRYNFTRTPVEQKPHQSVIERIKYNQAQARQSEKVSGREVLQRTARMKKGAMVSGITVHQPEVTSKLVPARRADSARKPASFNQEQVRGRAISQPASQEPSAPLTKKSPLPRMSGPGGESLPTEQSRHSVSEVTRPRPPQEGTIRTDQSEKPARLKEERRRPQPPQSAVLTQPERPKQPAETPQAVSRPIAPRPEKKVSIGQPESPVKREEGKRVINPPHSAEPDQPEHRRPAGPGTVAPPVDRDIRVDQPASPVRLRQDKTVPGPSPSQRDFKKSEPQQPIYQYKSPPPRQSGYGQQQQYQQRYAPQQGVNSGAR